MFFASDNWSGAAPAIVDALGSHSTGFATAYGESELDLAVEARFAEIFEVDCDVFFVGTGTAANSLAASTVCKAGGVIFCQSEAHVIANEGGAPEAFTSGGRLVPVKGDDGLMDVAELQKAINAFPQQFNHLGRGVMTTITQSTEAGTVYSLDHIKQICEVSKSANLPVHLDGARFANALVALDCSPAEMTWKQGVDMVSFGGTKNGCWCAEALLVFNQGLKEEIRFQRKRMGHLFSKTRFISAQFEAYLKDENWLTLARHSNAMGAKLFDVISTSNRVRPAWNSNTNQVFMIADQDHAQAMLKAGAHFYEFPAPQSLIGKIEENERVYRMVTSFATTQSDVDEFAKLLSSSAN